MAMLRAVLDGCSTTGRSMLPALGASLSPWSIFVQSRGAKSAGRTVEICLLQVRFVVRAVVPRTIDRSIDRRRRARAVLLRGRSRRRFLRRRARPRRAAAAVLDAPPRARVRVRSKPKPVDRQDVEGLGRDGEVVSVKPGRARNHLVPYKFAAYSSPERLAEAAKKRESWDVRETVDDAAGVDPAVKVPPFRLFAIPPSRSRPARARERDDARLVTTR
eukprot:31239-Pelagococcus_subviridis.AAC.3